MEKQDAYYTLVPYLMVVLDMRQDIAIRAATELCEELMTWHFDIKNMTLPTPPKLEEWLMQHNYIKTVCIV